MKFLKTILILSLFTFISMEVNSQSYKITHLYMVKNGSPRAISGKIIIKDSTFTMVFYGTDTTTSNYKIVKTENGIYHLSNGHAYIFSEAATKSERKEGIFYVESTYVSKLNDEDRKSMYFRVDLY